VGKTMMGLTLAQALRQQRAWPDGVWMIELAAMDAAEASISQLGAHLAHRLQPAAAATEGVDALATTMKGMALLLLLDNAEHVLPALAPLLGHLLAHVQGLHCVVTSREPLQLSGEQVFRLGPLGVPDLGDGMGVTQLMDSGAMRLFVDRVAERLPGFVLHTTQQDAAVRLCIAMDGLPLALGP
jgi:predicted ATPase